MIARLEAQNVLLFDELDLELPRSAAIVGPNGAGKSSLLACIEYGLTGRFGLPGVKEDNVRLGAPEGAPSFVRLHLDVRGERLAVTRGLRRSTRALLEVDGESVADGERAVTAELRRRLGVDPAVFAELAVVRQGRVADPLIGEPAARKEMLLRLVGLDEAKDLLEPIEADDRAQARLLADLGPPPDADRLRLEHEAAAEARRRAEATAAGAAVPAEAAAAAAERRLRLGDRDRAAFEAEQAAREADRQAESASAAAVAHEQAVRALNRSAAAREALRRWAAAEQTRDRARADRALADPAAPAPPADYVPPDLVDRLRADAAARSARRASAEARLALVRSGVCPTCGAATATRDDPAALEAAVADDRAFEVMASRALEATAAFDRAVRDHAAAVARTADLRRRAAADLEAAEAILAGRSPESWSEARAEADLESARTRGALEAGRRAQAESAIAGAAALERDRAAARLRALDDRLAALEATIRSAGLDPEDPRLYEAGAAEASAAAAALPGLVAAEAVALERLAVAEREAARRGRIAAWRGILGRGRARLGRDGLPRRLAADRLAAVEDRLAAAEAALNLPFSLSFSEALEPEVAFDDGVRRHAAGRLSGGQLVLAALAYRLALGSASAAELGLLALDEPTEWVAEERRAAVREALGTLVDWSGAAGMQVLLVTHHPELAALLGAEIRLGEPGPDGAYRWGEPGCAPAT